MSDAAATATDATTPAADDTATESEQQDATDYKAEAEKLKAASRKWEDRAKANAAAAKELDELRKQSMSDIEKAVDAARNEARAEVLREVGATRVDDAVKVAAAGRRVDIDALLEGLDRSRFLTDEHLPDTDAIAKWVDRIAPVPDDSSSPFPDLGQGVRTSAVSPGDDDALLSSVKSALSIR
jgi:hypothetical protein